MFHFFRRRNHRRLLDSFALLDSGKWNAIQTTAEQVISDGKQILLVAHFPWTFNWLQSKLDKAGLGYRVSAEFLTPNQLAEHLVVNSEPTIHLLLAKQLLWEPQNVVSKLESEVAVVVCERYPVLTRDTELERYLKAVPLLTTIGYFLSLQEPLIERAVGDTAVTVMKQLGLNEHELITSQILTRRIDRFIKKLTQSIEREVEADSQTEWLEVNCLEGQQCTPDPEPNESGK